MSSSSFSSFSSCFSTALGKKVPRFVPGHHFSSRSTGRRHLSGWFGARQHRQQHRVESVGKLESISPPHAADWAAPLLIQKLGSSRSESGGDRRCHFRHFPFQTSEYISATQLDVSVLRGSTIAPVKGGCFRVGSTIPVGRLLQVKILWCHQPATKFIKTATHTLQEIKGNAAVS